MMLHILGEEGGALLIAQQLGVASCGVGCESLPYAVIVGILLQGSRLLILPINLSKQDPKNPFLI